MKSRVEDNYNHRITNFSSDLVEVKKKIKNVIVFRTILGILGIGLCVYLFNISLPAAISVIVVTAILFYLLVKKHNGLEFSKLQLVTLIKINEEEVNRLAGNNKEYSQGEEYIDLNHPYAADLDLFGKGSLFQYINRTSGFNGSDCLAQWLLEVADEKEILLRQEAITELKSKTDWRQNFQAIGRLTKEKKNDLDLLDEWLNEPAFFSNLKTIELVLSILPVITIGLLFLSISFIPIG
ncbi:MAG: hypothetical protein ACPGD5_09830, partial [Salibacteraceae bacterium]